MFITDKCKGCQIEIHRTTYEINRNEHLFCTRKCYNTKQGPWNRGKTKETNKTLLLSSKKISKTLKQKPLRKRRPDKNLICEQCKKVFTNFTEKKNCSIICAKKSVGEKALVRIIKRMLDGTNPPGRSKWISYTKPSGEVINLQGSYEIYFATFLDKHNIKYSERHRVFKFIDKSGKNRAYMPDFYLYDLDLYVETKGYWHSDDREKFSQFEKTYPSIKVLVLFYKDLFKTTEEKLSNQLKNFSLNSTHII